MKCLILAGGLATRLGARTQNLPKSLLLVSGKPFIAYQLEELHRQGIKEVTIGIGHLGDQIKKVVGDGSNWNLRVGYCDEGSVLLGTGGAVRLFIDRFDISEKFFLMYGDSFLQLSFDQVRKCSDRNPSDTLLTLIKNEDAWDLSNVVFDGKKVKLYDKKVRPKPKEMIYIDYGLSVIDPQLVKNSIPANTSYDLSTFLHEHSLRGRVSGLEVKDRFYEVGSEAGIKDFENFVKEKRL